MGAICPQCGTKNPIAGTFLANFLPKDIQEQVVCSKCGHKFKIVTKTQTR